MLYKSKHTKANIAATKANQGSTNCHATKELRQIVMQTQQGAKTALQSMAYKTKMHYKTRQAGCKTCCTKPAYKGAKQITDANMLYKAKQRQQQCNCANVESTSGQK